MFSKYLLNEWMNKNTQDPSKSAPWLPFQLHQLSFSQPLVLRCQQNKWPFVFWKCHASLVRHRLYFWASFIWNCHPNNLSASCKKQLHPHLLHEAFIISPGVTQALLRPHSNSTCRSTFHAGYVTVPLRKKSQADTNRYLTDQILI